MFQLMVTAILVAALAYIVCGLILLPFFIARGLQAIDDDVPGSSWGFRVIIIPGIILFWPWLLKKWVKALNK